MFGERDSALQRPAVAVVVAAPERRPAIAASLELLDLTPEPFDDPYDAMTALCSRRDDPLVLLLSLAGLHREELQIIPAVRRLRRAIEVWLTDFDGRPAALADAMRLGVDALLGDDGLHAFDHPPENEVPDHGRQDDFTLRPPYANGRAAASPDGPRNGRHDSQRDDASAQTPESADEPMRVNRPTLTSAAAFDRLPDAGPAADEHGMNDRDQEEENEPILTADELRALLHEPSPAASRTEHQHRF